MTARMYAKNIVHQTPSDHSSYTKIVHNAPGKTTESEMTQAV